MAQTTIRRLTCISCPLGCALQVTVDETGACCKVEGNTCERGRKYACAEVECPRRMVTFALCVPGFLEPLSVKTASPVPLSSVPDVMDKLQALQVSAPIHAGQVVAENICNTGVAVIATKSLGE